MRSRLALVLALAGALVSGPAATSTWAGPERRAPVVSAVDAAGDVTIRDVAGPTEEQRANVDLLGFKVSRLDDDIRFTFQIRRVSTSVRFDQLLEVRFVDADPGEPRVSGEATLRVQHSRSASSDATLDTDNGSSGTGCLGYRFVVNKARGLVKLDLGLHCLPPGALSIRVKSFAVTPTGERRTVYSRDYLRVPGVYDLGGLAGSDFRR